MKYLKIYRCALPIQASYLLGLMLLSSNVRAERLELGVAISPLLVLDNHYEAFSSGDRYALRGGLDVRSEVVNLAGFRLLPFVGYRFAADEGEPYGIIETKLNIHDLLAGVRVRKGLNSWLGVLLDVKGGFVFANVEGELVGEYDEIAGLDLKRRYEDERRSWLVGAAAGIEFQISKSWLRSRGVRRFGFGGDISVGYLKRGNLDVSAELQTGDESDIKTETLPWGNLDISGLNVELSLCVKFF